MARYRQQDRSGDGLLRARPGHPSTAVSPGLHRLDLDKDRAAALYVPAGYRGDRPAPFVLSLHGAGGNELLGLYPLHDLADDAGTIVLSPASRGQTWDMLVGGYGPDVATIDAALAWAFDRCTVDPGLIAISGFSDGASYSLSLGVMNGDLFRHVLAFSPGFMAPSSQQGMPRFFVSHGTDDPVLQIDRTSRQVVPSLRDAGYDVTYVEFVGGHSVPPEIAREGLDWLLQEPSPATPDPDA